MAEFKWTTEKENAAFSLAQDELTDEQIASAAGVSRQALAKWKTDPQFAARVQSHVDDFRQTVRRHGIAILENRVRRLNRDWHKLQSVIDDRAADAVATKAMNEALIEECLRLGGSKDQLARLEKDLPFVAPGMETGHVVRDYKGTGPFIRAVFSVDTATLSELRAIEQQAAKELGQWVDKQESDIGGDSLSLLRKILIGDSEKPGSGETALELAGP